VRMPGVPAIVLLLALLPGGDATSGARQAARSGRSQHRHGPRRWKPRSWTPHRDCHPGAHVSIPMLQYQPGQTQSITVLDTIP